MNNLERVVLYMRYSSAAQNDGFSIEAQDKALTQYCRDNNLKIVKKYIDRAQSAKSTNRIEFRKMMEDAEKGEFEAVLVHKIDRFARNNLDYYQCKYQLEDCGVKLISITENYGEGEDAEFMEGINALFAERYIKNLAKEVRKGMDVVASNCLHTGGSPPLGYRLEEVEIEKDGKKVKKTKLAIDEEKAETVRFIFDEYAKGGTYNSIAKELELRGIKRVNYKGEEVAFSASGISEILHNRKYIGEYVYNLRGSKKRSGKANSRQHKPESEVIRIPDGIPRIVDDETFNKVQRRLESNKKRTQTYKPRSSYLLSGLIECGKCGYHYQGNSRKSGAKKVNRNNDSIYSSYRCGKTQNQKGGCDNGEIEKNRLENFVIEQLQRHLFSDLAIAKITELVNKHNEEVARNKDTDLIRYETELKEIKKQIKNLVDSIAKGVPQEMLAEKMISLQDTQNELEKRIKSCSSKFIAKVNEDDVKKALQKFNQYIKENNTPEIKAFLHSYIDKIVINEDDVEVFFKICSDNYNHEATKEESGKVLVDVEISRKELAQQPKQKRKTSASAINGNHLKEISVSE